MRVSEKAILGSQAEKLGKSLLHGQKTWQPGLFVSIGLNKLSFRFVGALPNFRGSTPIPGSAELDHINQPLKSACQATVLLRRVLGVSKYLVCSFYPRD